MKMNNILNVLKPAFLICITCLLSGGCTDDNVLPQSQTPLSGKTVPVKLSIGIDDYNTSPAGETRSGGDNPVLSASYPDMDIELVKTPVTRATSAAATTVENAVYKYIILQFNGTKEDATLLKKTEYECPEGIIKTDAIEAFESTGGPNDKHRFMIIANIDLKDLNGLTERASKYSDLQNLFFSWSADSAEFPLHKVTTSGTQKDAMIMCGMTYAAITRNDQQISIGLQRTVAKVTFNVKTDNQAFDKFEKWDMVLVNIPSKSYFNTQGRKAVFPDMTGTAYWSKLFTTAPSKINNKIDLGGDDISSLTEKSAYIPVNLQQTVNTATTHSRREQAPIGGTYLQLMGREMMRQSDVGATLDYVIYQIYLGNNLTTDYSIYPNYNLTYNITLKGRDESDSNVVRFIPGYFTGALTAYDANGIKTDNPASAVKWQYAKKIEAYYKDALYPYRVDEMLGRKDLRWYTGTSYSNLGAISLTNGFENTQKLQSQTSNNAYVQYAAATTCHVGLAGAIPGGSTYEDTQWYLPAIGELIGTWISATSMVSTLSPSYWSSTATSTQSQTAYIITRQGEVKVAPVRDGNNRHYVRGVRVPPPSK